MSEETVSRAGARGKAAAVAGQTGPGSEGAAAEAKRAGGAAVLEGEGVAHAGAKGEGAAAVAAEPAASPPGGEARQPGASRRRSIREGRRARQRRRAIVTAILLAAVVALYVVSVTCGSTFYGLPVVWDVIRGEDIPGATYAVGEIRLPRASLALFAGLAFGAGGITFQTMLRNQLASPDIIGISAGASATGVIGILMLHMDDGDVSLMALAGALATAMAIYFLSYRKGFAGTRLILVGIGVAAILNSVVTYVVSKAAMWDLVVANRWLTGSLHHASWERLAPLALACALLLPFMVVQSRNLNIMRFGDDSAMGLGVNVQFARVSMIICAVGLVAMATSACGPIAFVAFMAGPIAARVMGPGASLLIPSAMIGAILVMASDFAGQYFFGVRYPVGVITGVLGAPYLIYLLIRSNRSGSSL
ncbi:MAG: iron chelate uptake ABC transporter family permease subunit [Actinomycetaceae bacterium]|nr:iron chelate uptake ABC transporter family permease subunit [Actinomycetaceae bacterium]